MQQNLANSSATCAAWMMDGKNGSQGIGVIIESPRPSTCLGKGYQGGGELLVTVAINSSYNSYQPVILPSPLSGHLARQVRDKLRVLSSTERGGVQSPDSLVYSMCWPSCELVTLRKFPPRFPSFVSNR